MEKDNEKDGLEVCLMKKAVRKWSKEEAELFKPNIKKLTCDILKIRSLKLEPVEDSMKKF
jgi:hypothetical protein